MAKAPIGLMKEKVVFQVNSAMPDGRGGFKNGYANLLTTRGQMRNNSGSRMNEAGQIFWQEEWILETRYQLALENNVVNDTRVICNNQSFSILGKQLVDNKKFRYRFTLKAEVITSLNSGSFSDGFDDGFDV